MSKWIHQTSQWLLIGLLMVSMGGHLALLQTFAWGKMMVDFSATSSLTEAVGKTFDGAHPCALCKVVKKTKGEEEKKTLVKAEMKMELALPAPVTVPFPRWEDHIVSLPVFYASFRPVYQVVLLQPPRMA